VPKQHYSPKLKREVLAEYWALRDDHLAKVAMQLIFEKYGVAESTLHYWKTHSPAPAATNYYTPNFTVPKPASVELLKETTVEFFISDVHFHPEPGQGHDPAAWQVVEEALKHFQPDIVFFGGDICDMYAPSRYDKVPRLATPEAFQAEVIYCQTRLREIREICPNARFIWLTGNHETRLPRSVMTNAPWLFNYIRNIESVLDLSRLDIEYVQDGFQIGKLRHYHGHNNPGSGRVNAAKTKFERLLCNAIFGHHHKFSKWLQRDQDGGYFGAYVNGCVQWLSTDYAPNPDWTQGWTVVEYSKGGLFHVDQVLIHKPAVWSFKAEALYSGIHIKVDTEKS
jgi:hypothetical protein